MDNNILILTLLVLVYVIVFAMGFCLGRIYPEKAKKRNFIETGKFKEKNDGF